MKNDNIHGKMESHMERIGNSHGKNWNAIWKNGKPHEKMKN